MCNEPERLRCALYPARDALVATGAPDGWGLAFFQGGEVLLQRHPKPVAGPLDLYAALKDLRTDYVVGNVRDPGGAPAKLENTQPFRFRQWVFCHSGAVERFAAIQTGMLESVPDFLRRNIRGQTDSEHLFHLFLAFLHDAGKLDDPNISVGDAVSAVRATTAMLDRLVTSAGGAAPPTSVVLANGRLLLAERRGRPMWLRRQSGVADCRVCRELHPADGQGPGAERRRYTHEHLRSVLLVSEPQKIGPAGDGWEEVPDGAIVAVARDLATSTHPLRAD
jgi:glutamine amidotransferase